MNIAIKSQKVTVRGVTVLTVDCFGLNDYINLPRVIWYANHYFGRHRWNQSQDVAYYRDDIKVAMDAQGGSQLY